MGDVYCYETAYQDIDWACEDYLILIFYDGLIRSYFIVFHALKTDVISYITRLPVALL